MPHQKPAQLNLPGKANPRQTVFTKIGLAGAVPMLRPRSGTNTGSDETQDVAVTSFRD